MTGHPLFARVYDRMLASVEKAGLGDRRRELLRQASGRTLEIGAGTGANLPHYPEAVTELVLAEPDPHMAVQLRNKLEEDSPGLNTEVIEAGAEDIPFDDGSFDTVVSTLVLCTVESPERSIAEIKRVLADDGAFLYIEHVLADTPGRARVQNIVEKPWGLIAGGCHPNRPTGDTLAEAGLWIERLDRDELAKSGPIIKPIISGVARRPSSVSSSSS